MPLMDHIRELRNRVVKIALALLVGTGIGLIPVVFHRVWNFVQHPFCAATINGMTGCHQVHRRPAHPAAACSTRSCCGWRSRSSSG